MFADAEAGRRVAIGRERQDRHWRTPRRPGPRTFEDARIGHRGRRRQVRQERRFEALATPMVRAFSDVCYRALVCIAWSAGVGHRRSRVA